MNQEESRETDAGPGGNMEEGSESEGTTASIPSADCDGCMLSIDNTKRSTEWRFHMNEKQKMQPKSMNFDIIAINELSRSES